MPKILMIRVLRKKIVFFEFGYVFLIRLLRTQICFRGIFPKIRCFELILIVYNECDRKWETSDPHSDSFFRKNHDYQKCLEKFTSDANPDQTF